MKLRRRFERILAALLFVALSIGTVLAQDEQGAYPPANAPTQQGDYGQGAPQQQQPDPPGRVARVQYMSGEVSMQPGGVNDWVAASLNRPLTTADRVWTDKNSKAELNVGDGFLRMNSETSVTLTNVSDSTVQIELDQGTLSVTVKHLERGEIYEIDTPNYAFTVMKTGSYRFDVYPSQDQSWVTVRSGYGQATGKGAAVRVNSGTQIRFSGSNSLQHVAYDAPSRDGFDDWVQVRDKRLDSSLSARYVSPGVIGYQDLDGYGNWVTTGPYGPVWIPNSVPTGWAPYRFGHWVWIAPWGWTWVDDAPWGFAPFHYGRWVSWGGYWGWSPGPVGYWNPYYAPALVGWIGGGGFSVGFGFGGGWGFGVGLGFGWFPLGWGEPFYPRYCGWGHGGWYRGGGWASNNYIRNVNVTNTHINNINNVTHNYRNNNIANARYGFRNVSGAVTAAPRTAFTSGAAINRVGGAVPRADLGRGSIVNGADVHPTRQSVLGGREPLTHGVPPTSATNRGVVTSGRTTTRPANFEAANRETMARSNPSQPVRSGMNAAGSPNNPVRQPVAGSANNGRPTSSPATAQSNAPARGPAGNPTQSRANPPASQAGHSVPRPPTNNDTFARQNGNSGPMANNRGPSVTANQRYGTNSSTVSRPPMANQPSHPMANQPNHTTSGPQQYSTQSAQRVGSQNSSRGGSYGVPRPPSNYSYHAAPAYSASSTYGHPSVGSNGGSSRSYGSAPNYSTGRSYGSTPAYNGRSYGSNPGYSANRGYGSNPGYSANRGNGSSPSYSSRGMGSSSAPRYSGRPSGGGGYHAPSGGGYHAPSGGGGGYHGGGGGGSHASGGGGGGHHGR